ncbi:hypothetical protein B0A58_07470 [Flavobacterium branchiophilum NBRC 15030 = ATCC 35035]|uniref:Uncharacterized protein n=2 Tax=Flavobacterium branchiophilum TaxID=55197 RepID=A0A543G101_9FLAO|nr:hypothetical protein [Flavobacterium branchiophilum]OXA76403.1 hypothetical protein B0A58_07470 [Flavobacterium branchiophilum NBRC 15030 = ATCC 35035]TQM39772.1 hypothetical protein BC670_0603 [Flavobacterium branchiophilum]
MNWVIINFYELVVILLPLVLRKPKAIAFLKILILPLHELYTRTLYQMQHTCQVMYLEKVLNEYYHISGYNASEHEATKKIKIIDEYYPPECYLFLEQEDIASIEYDNEVLWLDEDNVFLTDDQVYYDFVVLLPIGLLFEQRQLIELVNYFKLAGKKWYFKYDL